MGPLCLILLMLTYHNINMVRFGGGISTTAMIHEEVSRFQRCWLVCEERHPTTKNLLQHSHRIDIQTTKTDGNEMGFSRNGSVAMTKRVILSDRYLIWYCTGCHALCCWEVAIHILM